MTHQEQAVQHVIHGLFESWKTLDPVRFAGAFAQDAQFTDVVGNTASGRAAIAELHVLPFTQLFKNAVIELLDTPIVFVTSDVASVDMHWKMRGHTTSQGASLPPRKGLLHVVVVRRDHVWWPVVAHNTDYTAAYAGPAPDSLRRLVT